MLFCIQCSSTSGILVEGMVGGASNVACNTAQMSQRDLAQASKWAGHEYHQQAVRKGLLQLLKSEDLIHIAVCRAPALQKAMISPHILLTSYSLHCKYIILTTIHLITDYKYVPRHGDYLRAWCANALWGSVSHLSGRSGRHWLTNCTQAVLLPSRMQSVHFQTLAPSRRQSRSRKFLLSSAMMWASRRSSLQ